MLIVLNEQDEQEQVIDELSDKIFVETLFIMDLDKFFGKILRAIGIDLRKNEKNFVNLRKKQVDVVQMFEEELDTLLTRNYKRGAAKAIERFKTDKYVNQLLSKQEILRIIEESSAAIDYHIVTRETFISKEILKTTENNLIQSQTFVDKLIREEELALTASERNSLVMDNLTTRVENRKPLIAETETQNVYQASKQKLGTAIAPKLIREGQSVEKRWNAILDQKTRPEHARAHGQRVPFDRTYTVWGEQLMYPGDTGYGASLKNVVRCLHPSSIINDADIKKMTRRLYNGKMIVFQTSSGNKLTVTPNHPILTGSGWKLARFINKRDCVISCNTGIGIVSKNFNIKNIKSSVEEIFNSFYKTWTRVRMPSIVVNFHGESVDKDVDVIFRNRFLRSNRKVIGFNIINKFNLTSSDTVKSFLFNDAKFFKKGIFKTVFSYCNISIFSKFLSVFKTCLRHSQIHRFASISLFDSFIVQNPCYSSSGKCNFFFNSLNGMSRIKQVNNGFYNISVVNFFKRFSNFDIMFSKNFSNKWNTFFNFVRNLFNRLFNFVKFDNPFFKDQIIGISHFNYSGFVYNLETKNNIYISNGIVNHNCRCESIMAVIKS